MLLILRQVRETQLSSHLAQSQSTNTENTYAYLHAKSQLESHIIGMKELRHIMLVIVVTTILSPL